MSDTAIKRKVALGLSALAIVSMGSITVACSPRTEKPAEPGVSETAPPAMPANPTEKNVRTNVTRAPISAGPQGGGHGNAAVPCGFGPQGGARCGGY